MQTRVELQDAIEGCYCCNGGLFGLVGIALAHADSKKSRNRAVGQLGIWALFDIKLLAALLAGTPCKR